MHHQNTLRLRVSSSFLSASNQFALKPLVAALLFISAVPAMSEEIQAPTLEELVVTGVRTSSPLTVVTDPKAPRQPLPAHDGADYLKTIPGFSVIRKGGADGDPLLRGMAGSRLVMSIDGETILGGCSNRMDPPTAYVFPESFDEIKVIKGPQTVAHGSGNSAGVVLFERNNMQPELGWNINGSVLAGSFGRQDEAIDFTGAGENFYVRGMATYTEQDNYEDGDGVEVHSRFERWNSQLALGWMPNEDTTVELNGSRSDGEAAYADRGVDGSKFDRDNLGLKFNINNVNDHLQRLEAQAYYNYVDHVMDNFSLREPAGMMAMPMAMNPDRETQGARLATHWAFDDVKWIVGADYQKNLHSNRNTMNQTMMPYQNLPRIDDSEFEQSGLFTEVHVDLDSPTQSQQRFITGVRVDHWQAQDLRDNVALSMMMSSPNPTAGEERSENLTSGFARYEADMNVITPATMYVGIGRTERFPDYWELISKETQTSISAFDTKVETTTQLDVGMIFRGERVSGSVSTYYSDIDDYVLIQSGVSKPAGMMGTRMASIARNVDAKTWGLEADARYALSDQWSMNWTLASVRGSNESDDTTLAQLPPLEMRFGLNYDNSEWAFGTLYRWVDDQTRVDINSGNIVGQDLGETDGFGILSVNASWKPSQRVRLFAGIDNLTDKTYAEHLSRAGALISGFEQTTRVNEPGRTLWLKAQFDFN